MRLTLALAAAAMTGCAGIMGGPGMSDNEFDREIRANEMRIKEDRTRSSLARIESSLADYIRAGNPIPDSLDKLIPKYLAEVPSLDLPVCGSLDSNRVTMYPADALRDGQVNGTRLRGTGRWGYVFSDERVVIFVDCLKPALNGVPWYQIRGVY